ncbi:helix-turn-helix domain-containing protein [Streptomyces sp. NPDC003442]
MRDEVSRLAPVRSVPRSKRLTGDERASFRESVSAVYKSDPDVSIRDISGATGRSFTGLKRPTVHRLVLAMQELGLVEADPQGRFIVGARLICLAMGAQRAIADVELRQELGALRATTGVRSVRLDQRCGDQRICIAEDRRLKSAASNRNPARAVAIGTAPSRVSSPHGGGLARATKGGAMPLRAPVYGVAVGHRALPTGAWFWRRRWEAAMGTCPLSYRCPAPCSGHTAKPRTAAR